MTVVPYNFTDNDMALMNRFVKTYGHPNAMPMEQYLNHWYEAKNQYLLDMFHDQLIISEEVEYKEPDYIISNRMQEIFYEEEWISTQRWLVDLFKAVAFKGYSYDQVFESRLWWQDEDSDIYNTYRMNYEATHAIRNSLSDISVFTQNKVLRENLITARYTVPEIVLRPNGNNYLCKPFVIREGQKPFRLINSILALYHIANSLDPEKFSDAAKAKHIAVIEKYRLRHSVALNTKILKGELCLSIHPLDYLTASDNASNWCSCMTWTRKGYYGEFRNGVVELMNSPMVVIAYLNNSKKPFHIFSNAGDNEPTWNNKMWREFFIVDKEYIAAIKAYPYHCSTLETMVLNKLADMATEAHDWEYNREVRESSYDVLVLSNEEEVNMETDFMYNDTIDNGARFIESANLPAKDDYLHQNANGCYSGQMYCIVCGKAMFKPDDDDDDTDCGIPYCDDCAPKLRCACCGDVIKPYPGMYAEIDGKIYCHECYTTCEYCGEKVLENDFTYITLVNKDNSVITWDVKFCPHCLDKYQDYLMQVDISNTDFAVPYWLEQPFWTLRSDAPDELLELFSKRRSINITRDKILDLTPYAI